MICAFTISGVGLVGHSHLNYPGYQKRFHVPYSRRVTVSTIIANASVAFSVMVYGGLLGIFYLLFLS